MELGYVSLSVRYPFVFTVPSDTFICSGGITEKARHCSGSVGVQTYIQAYKHTVQCLAERREFDPAVILCSHSCSLIRCHCLFSTSTAKIYPTNAARKAADPHWRNGTRLQVVARDPDLHLSYTSPASVVSVDHHCSIFTS